MPFKPKTDAGQIRWPLMAYLLTGNLAIPRILPVSKGDRQMPQLRKLDQTTLLALDAEGLTAVAMQRRLADEGTSVSLDLIRKRLSEARREAQGEPAAPRPQRKSSATARRQGQLAEAVKLLSDLQADLEGVVSGWGEDFVETDRYKRFDEAAQALQEIVVLLEDLEHRLGVGTRPG